MSFEMFDNISPKITLFYNTRKKHTSFISAVISLVVYLCLAGLSFYFIYDFITNSIAKAYYFIKFTNDTEYTHSIQKVYIMLSHLKTMILLLTEPLISLEYKIRII